VQVCRRLEAGDPHVHTHEYGDAMLKEDFAADSRYVVLACRGGGVGATRMLAHFNRALTTLTNKNRDFGFQIAWCAKSGRYNIGKVHPEELSQNYENTGGYNF
jgi:hypothetical protein